MPVTLSRDDHNRAQTLVQQLASRLRHHVLWDALLVFLPPLGAVVYIIAVLFRTAWIGSSAALLLAIAVLAAGIVGVLLQYRPRLPSISAAAHLADQQSGAKDHFLTLATLDSEKYPLSLMAKLRREASVFGDRLQLKRDFPYQLKRSAYWSVGVSLFAVMVIEFGLPIIREVRRDSAIQTRLRQLAQEMATKPELKPLAAELQALAAKLNEPTMSPVEKQQMAQEMERKIEQQQNSEQKQDSQDLLSQAADALQRTEQQISSGNGGEKNEQKGGGGIESNLPQKGQGEGKEGQGSGTSKGDSSKAELSADQKQGKEAQAKPNDSGTEKKSQQAGAAKNSNQADSNQTKQPNKQQAGKAEGSKDGSGRQQTSDQPPPAGTAPADRFYGAGEGQQGLSGAGYVTVQLPEEIATGEKGESGPSKDSKASRTRSQVPVSNMPLPAHVPNAATEKQEIPIEYRGMIR